MRDEQDRWAPFRAGRRQVDLLGILTLVVFGGGGVLLMQFFQGRMPLPVILGSTPVAQHLALGAGAGLLVGYSAWGIVRMPFMQGSLVRYSRMVGPLLERRRDRVFISLCAGVGEELFFRGALQFWLGIPVTAVLFVAVHGYLDPRNWRISIYGLFMTVAMAGFGWMADTYGLLGPMVAHAVVDIVLLEKLQQAWRHQRGSHEV